MVVRLFYQGQPLPFGMASDIALGRVYHVEVYGVVNSLSTVIQIALIADRILLVL